MIDESLNEMLRAAIRPSTDAGRRRDLWPQMAFRFDQRPRWSYVDLGLAAAVVVALTVFPDWLWLLSYHL